MFVVMCPSTLGFELSLCCHNSTHESVLRVGFESRLVVHMQLRNVKKKKREKVVGSNSCKTRSRVKN